MKLVLQNKYVQLVSALLIGSALTYLFLPTKIETHEIEKIVNRDVVAHSVKTIRPDGTVTVVTDTKDLSRETVKDVSKKQVGYNGKKLLVYGGMSPIHRDRYVVGGSYNVYGPIDIGVSYQSGIYITVGLRF